MKMEPIKISVEVSVNLSETTQNFISSLFRGSCHCVTDPNTSKPVKAEPVKAEPSISIEDVRAALSKKVNTHRDSIKEKLNSFNAPSVTKLDPKYYAEMYNFLSSL